MSIVFLHIKFWEVQRSLEADIFLKEIVKFSGLNVQVSVGLTHQQEIVNPQTVQLYCKRIFKYKQYLKRAVFLFCTLRSSVIVI